MGMARFRGVWRGLRVVCIAALLAGLAQTVAPTRVAYAATFVVDTTADGNDGECTDDCTLREAIGLANGAAGPDTITLPGGTYVLTLGGVGDNSNATGDLDITDDLTINGSANSIIDGNGTDRALDVDPGLVGGIDVTINDVTIQNGGVAGLISGGGIRNAGALTLTNSTLITNTAEHGGGLFNTGTAVLNNVTVGPANSATNGSGGGISGGTTGSQLSLAGCTVVSNTASVGGGGLFSAGTATVDDSDFAGNQAANNGGGVSNGDGAQLWLVNGCTVEGNTAGAGGGVFNTGTAVLDNTTIGPNNSSTAGNGGGISNVDPVAGPPALLTLTNGTVVKENTANTQGGGIWNAGTANLDGVTVGPNNTATASNGGGISNGTAASQLTVTNSAVISGTAGDQGGGIFNTGTLTLDGSDITDNQAGTNGGGISTGSAGGQLTVSGGSTVSDNSANNGGGIWSLGTLTVTASTVGPDNRATAGGGGGIFNQGTGTVASTGVTSNTASGTGGGILNMGTLALDDVTVGPYNTADSGGGINSTASATWLTLKSSRVLSNTAAVHAGGIMNHSSLLVHDNCSVTDNTAESGEGGGLHNGEAGVATVDHSTIGGGNHAGNNGGGIWNAGAVTVTNVSAVISNTAAAHGGGVWNGGQARVITSTVSGNEAQDGVGGGISNGVRGAQLTLKWSTVGPGNVVSGTAGAIYNGGTTDLTNSTVSGNVAEPGHLGGIFNDNRVTLLNVTVAENQDGGLGDPVSGITLTNTLVGDNSGADCYGTPVSNGNNLDSDGTCGLAQTGDRPNQVPLLGLLALNAPGGTETHALLAGSPAIDHIPPVSCTVATDQRGVSRPQGTNCDIGAYELERGTIVIEKQTEPDGAPDDFTFEGAAAGTIKDGDKLKVEDVVSGAHTITETILPGAFDLTAIVCSDEGEAGGSTVDLVSRAATVSLQPGEVVTCVFTNTMRGHIVVDKVTEPAGETESFEFNTTGTGYTGFSLTHGQAPNDQELAPGDYSVGEAVPDGWDLSDLGCISDLGTSTFDSGSPPTETVTLAPGDTVTCTFRNTKRGHIVVDKVTDPSGDPQGFAFSTTGTGYSGFSLADLDAPDDQELVPGDYSVSESLPAGWDLTDLGCSSSLNTSTIDTGSPPMAAITLAAGDTVTCVFTDTVVAVGGVVAPLDRVGLVALRLRSGQTPWMGLAAAIALVSLTGIGVVVWRRGRAAEGAETD